MADESEEDLETVLAELERQFIEELAKTRSGVQLFSLREGSGFGEGEPPEVITSDG
jgi:hypothetical protein